VQTGDAEQIETAMHGGPIDTAARAGLAAGHAQLLRRWQMYKSGPAVARQRSRCRAGLLGGLGTDDGPGRRLLGCGKSGGRRWHGAARVGQARRPSWDRRALHRERPRKRGRRQHRRTADEGGTPRWSSAGA
jgi:hypothetical protein